MTGATGACCTVLAVAGLVVLAAGATAAQIQLPFLRGERHRPRIDLDASNIAYDGRFVFLRLKYEGEFGGFGRRSRREPPWAHDYPRGERNFTRILDEVTYISPHLDASNILMLDDPALFECPVAYMSEPGYWTLSDAEAEGLRAYLHKGGFVIFDDFRGHDWENFAEQVRRVLPDGRLVELDASHPIFHAFFEIDSLDFVQYYDDGEPVFYGVFEDNDPAKRLMLVANYNNDLSEYWEFSDTGFIPIDLSNEAYKFGVNYVVYAMTH